MKLLSCLFLGAFLVFTVIDALPTNTDDQGSKLNGNVESINGKVREKRKIEGPPALVQKNTDEGPQKPAEQQIPSTPTKAEPDDHVPPKEISLPSENEEVARVKKQACAKQQQQGMRNAVMATNQQIPASEIIMLKNEPVEYAQPRMISKSMQRTFEPIYSFGPVAFNGMPGGAQSSATPYSAFSAGIPSMASSLHGSYGSPTSYQLHPLAQLQFQHRHPTYQHTAITLRNPTYVDYVPEVIYYEGKHGEETPQAVANDETVQLYCQPMKSTEFVKALQPEAHHDQPSQVQEKKLNVTRSEEVKEEKEVKEMDANQVAKVDQIKEEITQLNRAAQRIVEQQEQLAKMQHDHLARSANLGMPVYPEMRAPYMPFYQPSYQRPYMYRQDEGPKADAASTASPSDSSAAKTVSQQPEAVHPAESYYRQVMPDDSARFYFPHVRSETGFNVPSFMRAAPPPAPVPYSATQEDVEFFMRMLNVGKKMGVIAKDYQPSLIKPVVNAKEDKEDQQPHKSEDALGDLVNGPNQQPEDEKSAKEQEEEKPKDKKEYKKTRRDSRSLVMRA